MKSMIVGGGKIGFYLAKTLIEKKYHVVVIEKNLSNCTLLAESMDIEVICGDGTDMDVLIDAGIQEADVVAAVTGLDEENLVICQIAKMNFDISKTIARINNPKNTSMFRELGVDKTVCSTEVIANLIEYEFDQENYKIIQTFERGAMILVEIEIKEELAWKNLFVSELVMPEECVITSILRNEKVIFPRGNTRILEGDNVLVLTNHSSLLALKKLLKKEGLYHER